MKRTHTYVIGDVISYIKRCVCECVHTCACKYKFMYVCMYVSMSSREVYIMNIYSIASKFYNNNVYMLLVIQII